MGSPKKIYVFVNVWSPPDWFGACALCEDGHSLAGHASSSEYFVHHDMGLTSDWKHDKYDAHCGKGNWELEYVSHEQVVARDHTGLERAYALNQELAKAAKPTKEVA